MQVTQVQNRLVEQRDETKQDQGQETTGPNDGLTDKVDEKTGNSD